MAQVAAASNAAVMDLFKKPVPSSVLKRNTACHQCRKRKLKCDAKRPCATCLRSHAYAVAHAPKDKPAPPYPDCSYDDGADSSDEAPAKTKYEKLETRIGELEGLLREMTIALQEARAENTRKSSSPARYHSSSPDNMTTSSTSSSSDSSQLMQSPLPEASIFTPGTSTADDTFFSSMTSQTPGADIFIDSSIDQSMSWTSFDAFPNSSMSDMDFGILPSADSASSFVSDTTLALSFFSTHAAQSSQLLPSGWPPNLPSPEVTRHLIHALFAFWLHAGRLFHGPTFLAALDLPPSDARFPAAVVLHAMCAVGSMYAADVAPTPIHTSKHYPYEIFTGRWRKHAARPDSFAEQQIKFAQLAQVYNIDMGERLMESMQAQILITWFFMNQGRWSEAYINGGQSLRYCNAVGLTKAEPFKTPVPRKITHGKKEELLPAPLSAVDEEARRHLFWLAYGMEREQSAGNGFALELDDADINQLLPVRGDQFELGIRVPPADRQWSHDADVLLAHPAQTTDSFVLWLKATMLLSRVKAFNVRFKGRAHAGERAYRAPSSNSGAAGSDKGDPRDSPAFRELEGVAGAFRASFPPHLRDPVQDGTVDPHLYGACVGAHLAQLLLHDPHMNVRDPGCASLHQVSKAARAILDLMYGLSSTSYDVSLLDQLAFIAWNFAGRVLIQFLRTAIENNSLDQVFVLHSEICFVHSMLARAGERMPVAYRYKKTIYDALALLCGEQFVEPLPATSYHRYVSPPDSAILDPVPSIAPLFSAMAITYPQDTPLRGC